MPKSSARSARQAKVAGRTGDAKNSATKPAVSAPAATSASIVPALDPSALHRVVDILGALQRREKCTATTFAKQFGVTPMTISRTLELMRDRMGVEWDWDPKRGTYFLTGECDRLPLLRLEPREAVALALAAREFEHAYGPAFGQILGDLLDKVRPLFGGQVAQTLEEVDRIVDRRPPAPQRELDHFFPLFDAVRERHVLRLAYAKRGADRAGKIVVHPLRLRRRRPDSRWVLVAYDPRERILRSLLLTRMQKIDATGATFEPPAHVDVDAYIQKSMGAFAGDGEHEVRIALDKHAAISAREAAWHESQQLAERPNGGVELTLKLNHLADAKINVLRWGQHAEVLAPAELRDEVRAEHAAALARYSSGT